MWRKFVEIRCVKNGLIAMNKWPRVILLSRS